MSPAKTTELVKMPLGLWTQMGRRNHAVDGDPDRPREGAILREERAAHCKVQGPLRVRRRCKLFVKLLWPLVIIVTSAIKAASLTKVQVANIILLGCLQSPYHYAEILMPQNSRNWCLDQEHSSKRFSPSTHFFAVGKCHESAWQQYAFSGTYDRRCQVVIMQSDMYSSIRC